MSLTTFTPNTVIQSSRVNANFQNLVDHGLQWTIKWLFSGAVLLNQYNKDYISLPDDALIERVDLISDTAPTGADLIVDIERSIDGGATWNSIFSAGNRPRIVAAAKTGSTTTVDTHGVTGLTNYYRPVVDQIGSTIPGADISVMMRGNYNLD